MKKFENVICLDIDDCILSAASMFVGNNDDIYEVCEMNMKRLGMFLETYDMGLFITSAWYARFIIDDDQNLLLKREVNDGIHVENELKVKDILNKYAGGRMCGLSCGRRQEDIAKLLRDGHKVIAVDDMELGKDVIIDFGVKSGIVDPPTVSKKYHFAEVEGFVTNRLAYRMFKFMENIHDIKV